MQNIVPRCHAQVNPDARKMKVLSEAGDEASAGETAVTWTVENRARGISSRRQRPQTECRQQRNKSVARATTSTTDGAPSTRVNTKDQMLLLDCTVVYSTPRYSKHIGIKEALLGSSGIALASKLYKEMKGRIKGGGEY